MSTEDKKRMPRGDEPTNPSLPAQLPPDGALEGEGSYTGGRDYDRDASKFAKTGDVVGGARKAADALDGPEREDLKQAEKIGKAGKPQPQK